MAPGSDLHKMSAEELGLLFPIIISDHSEKWKVLFHTERDLILGSFSKKDIVRIDHVGSTAIPGLKAKPTIDILLQVSEDTDPSKIIDVFKELGYRYTKQPDNPPPHMMFLKGYSIKGFRGQAYHVHVRYKGNWNEIHFRDILLKDKKIAREYEELKIRLASKHRNNREDYTNGKSEFIEKVNKLVQEK